MLIYRGALPLPGNVDYEHDLSSTMVLYAIWLTESEQGNHGFYEIDSIQKKNEESKRNNMPKTWKSIKLISITLIFSFTSNKILLSIYFLLFTGI